MSFLWRLGFVTIQKFENVGARIDETALNTGIALWDFVEWPARSAARRLASRAEM